MFKERKEIEDLVYGFFRIIDPSGHNEKKYKEYFGGLDDKEFTKWADDFFKDEEAHFFLEALPYHNEPTLPIIKKAAQFLDIPLDEYICFPHLGGVITAEQVPCGVLFLKRHQQLLSKKNNIAANINDRSFRTGQVVDDSKAARISDMDNYALQVTNSNAILHELLSMRADDLDGKSQLYEKISSEGFALQ
jgi:hypothetical protein